MTLTMWVVSLLQDPAPAQAAAEAARQTAGTFGAVLQESGRQAPANLVSSLVLVPLLEWAKRRGWVKPGDENRWATGMAVLTAGSIHLSLDTTTWSYAITGTLPDLLRLVVDFAKQHGMNKWLYYAYRALLLQDPLYAANLAARRKEAAKVKKARKADSFWRLR